MKTILEDKHILLGITGSIAAYKAANMASTLTQFGAQVDVIMTGAAQKFVSPLTFQALTGRPVYTSMWQPGSGGGMGAHIAHVELGHSADLLLIAPATANTMARIAQGLADDLLSVTTLAARCPILIAPAMDVGMYGSPATQANVQTLRDRGVHFAGPTTGRMASGLEGLGRMLEPDEVIGHARRVLGMKGPLVDRHIVISAGPTQEALDPVRFISNHSSGKQGYAIAQAAVEFGARVTLISGPTDLSIPIGVERIEVTSAEDMSQAVLAHAAATAPADALIMAAAVADFRPSEIAKQKIKKAESQTPQLPLEHTPDVLLNVAQAENRPLLTIGFAAESNDLQENARAKLEKKSLDLIVANDIGASDAGFKVDTNRVLFITPTTVEKYPLLPKSEVAVRIMTWIAARLAETSGAE